MNSLKYVSQGVRLWQKRWGSYTLLALLISQILTWVVIPCMQWTTSFILRVNKVPYLSFDNLLSVTRHQPLAMLELFVLLLIIMVLVYFEFAIEIIGVKKIMANEPFRFWQVVKESWQYLIHLKVRGLPAFLIYLILIVPFGKTALNSPLLSKVRIPTFVFEGLIGIWWFSVAILVFFVFITYISIRFLRSLPISLENKGLSFNEAMKKSWEETRHQFWFYFWRLFWISAIGGAITWLYTAGLVAIQTAVDKTSFALISGIISITLLQVGLIVWQAFTTTLMTFLLISPKELKVENTEAAPIRPHHRKLVRGMTLVGILGIAVIVAAVNYEYMTGITDNQTKVVSHRGVDGNNGVQNTIPALEATAKKHPDYVEMDIHQTKDEEFVVMHDPNLKALAGVNKAPRDLTLKEMTKLTVKENGHEAKIPSFDEYLETAEKIKQPLIVELKTTKKDTPDVIDQFLNKYAKRLIRDGYYVHSLDYKVVTRGKELYPDLFVGFISPYNLVLPQSEANAYTSEQTTISMDMVASAELSKKQIWAWTVNDEDDMRSMLFLGVDAIITDDMDVLTEVLAEENSQPSYAQRLKNYARDTALLSERNGEEN